jgi:hypothetical protein
MRRPSDLAREQRRVILVLTDEQLRAGRRDDILVDYFDDDEATVIEIPGSLRSDDPLIQHLSAQNRLRPGSLLIQSPYNPSQYEFADAAVTEFAVAKFMVLTKVCQRLGATSVKVDNVNAKARNEAMQADIAAKTPVQSASVETNLKLEKHVREKLQLEDTFPGGPADAEGARQLLQDAGLEGDTALESLIDMRSGNNALTKREIKLSLTQDASHNLHVAAKYSGLKVAHLSSHFTRQVQENTDVVLSATITFHS